MPLTRFVEVKYPFQTSAHFLQGCGSQNTLFKALQYSYMACGGQNTLSKPLQASYTLCGVKNPLTELLEKV